jgi:thiol-disulfide isomerase/thioredoxin
MSALRRFAPLLIIAAGFVLVPLLVHRLFPPNLPATMPALNPQPHPLPEITFTDGAGRKFTVASFRGSVVLLNFWATWCVPCKEEMPSLNALAARLPAKTLTIVPVSIDVSGASAVRAYYRQLGLDKLPVFLDPSSEAMHRLAVVGIPTTILIDRDGQEIARQIGPAQWDAPAIVDGLARLAGKPR